MSNSYRYQDRMVRIAPTADMPRAMRPGGRFASIVQELLNDVEPWEDGQSPIETGHYPVRIWPMTVRLRPNDTRHWGVHRGHQAKRPEPSPFTTLRPRDSAEFGLLTIELTGTPERPILVRAYGGDYCPPLPWMSSAPRADGGYQACLRFWRIRAYYSPDLQLIKAGTATTPPDWFRP